MFGVKLNELGEDYLSATRAVIKQALAVDCCQHLCVVTGDILFD